MNYPIISIVIANYNYGRYLEDAINSIVMQRTEGKVELIICDGGSTDNSVEVIKRHEKEIAWWCSEKDKGQSDAFNKGFSHARGKFLTWLNADDVMPEGCLHEICREIECHPDCEWFTGNFFRFIESGKIIEIGWGPNWYPYWLQFKSSPLVVFGPTSFFSKKIYIQVGKIREDMYFMMDNDLWYRFMLAGVKMRRIHCFCWGFRMHAASKTAEYGDHRLSPTQLEAFNKERHACLLRTGYKQSIVLRLICLFLRVLDGSLLTKFWYSLTMRTYKRVQQ